MASNRAKKPAAWRSPLDARTAGSNLRVRDDGAGLTKPGADPQGIGLSEVHAIDYLPKPFDRERFTGTLRHAREQLRRAPAADADSRFAGP